MSNFCYSTITMVDGSTINKEIMDFILEKWDAISRIKETPISGAKEVYISSFLSQSVGDFLSELPLKSDGIKLVYVSDLDMEEAHTAISKNKEWEEISESSPQE